MGDTSVLDGLIPKTQEILQSLFAKPKLADKLLQKPPFRFLHDVFAAITQSTGFAKGLYNEFELDSANMKEKQQKISYLDKMIVCVGICLGKDVDVRSAKIVAGLEPENTNVFLQDLAAAASNSSLNWARAVQKTLEKVPSSTPDGGSAIQSGSAPPAEAKRGGDSRPGSKERGDDNAAAAAAEAKAKEKAKCEREEADRREKEAAAQLRESEAMRAKTEAKIDAKRVVAADNNPLDDTVQQEMRECNGDFEKTKEMIEKIISKPKMGVKLLSKPPFRFLHDIVSEITRVTAFGDGLYTEEELDSNNIKEKQPKIDYLNKIIQCVSCHLNTEIEAKPAKIVAGLEPEETNKFLQLLAIACQRGSSADAVQRVLSGDVAVRATSSRSTGAKRTAPSTTKSEAPAPEAKRPTTPPESNTRDAKTPATGTFSSGPMKATKANDDEDDGQNLRFQAEAKGTDQGDNGGGSVAPGTSGGYGTSRTSRPTTARRRPPKLKENVTEVGRLLVPDAKVAPVRGIMKDGDNAESDEDTEDNNHPTSTRHVEVEASHSGAHGRLVRDILKDEEASRKIKEDEDAKEAAGGPTLGESETGIRLGRRKKSFKDKSKGGASSAAEMQELRTSIQRICQVTLPMGKSIEFVHEDSDAMSKELEKWKKEYEKKVEIYEEEKKKTEEALQPLQVQLLEVEEQIKEQVHKINTLKATIAKNEDKTQQLLRMVVSA